MGLGPAGETHLDRLVDFGNAYGYEARQVRRYSDLGIRQLARLITSNWIVHAVPTLEVFASQQTNRSWAITLRATRPKLIDMSEVELSTADENGSRDTVHSRLADTSTELNEIRTLATPFVLAAAAPGAPRHLRFEWQGEVWPRFVMNVVGPVSPLHVLTSQTLGNALQLSAEVLTP